jgi:hypothetical protein
LYLPVALQLSLTHLQAFSSSLWSKNRISNGIAKAMVDAIAFIHEGAPTNAYRLRFRIEENFVFMNERSAIIPGSNPS